MTFFKPRGFVLAFRNKLIEKYEMVKVSNDPSPLMYSVSDRGTIIAWLSFEDEGGTVKVALDFSEDASDNHREELTGYAKETLNEGFGDSSEILS